MTMMSSKPSFLAYFTLVVMLTHNRASALASPLNSMEKRINKVDRLETRGSIYSNTNSTIPTAHMAATTLGVVPPLEAPAHVWKPAWMIHRAVMPFLHWGDRCKPPDSSLSLTVLMVEGTRCDRSKVSSL
jgi:hypothetical protein